MSSSKNTLDDPLAVGDTILDRYQVVERLETGGTSVVYRGEDSRLSRPVCIKVFHTLRDKEWIYRTSYEHFVQEAFALSKLSHPNTLRIYDFGHLPLPASAEASAAAGGDKLGAPFQVSEFMNGGTLSTVVRRDGPLVAPESGQVISAICGALDEAHSHGIVHRDIKPKNILFGNSGSSRAPKLADFGIAKSVTPAGETQGQLTNRAGDTHVVAGRKLLMYSGLWAAPEQLVGLQIGATADIYSFALVTIYMLTGRCVFSSNDPGEAYRQRTDSELLIEEVLKEVGFSEKVEALLKQACALDPDRRPPRAGEFARALVDALDPRSHRRLPLEPPGHLTPVPAPAPESPAEKSGTGTATGTARTDGSSITAPTASSPSGPPQRLAPSPSPQPMGDRTATFVAMDAAGTADVSCLGGRARVRVSLVPAQGGMTVHLRGLSCFVRKQGGRASGAVSFNASGAIELVAPNQQLLGAATIDFGGPAAGHNVFRVGDGLYAVGVEECPRVIALDFGAGGECVFVYVPRAPTVAEAPRSKRRTGDRREA